jgi:hypothetical protein
MQIVFSPFLVKRFFQIDTQILKSPSLVCRKNTYFLIPYHKYELMRCFVNVRATQVERSRNTALASTQLIYVYSYFLPEILFFVVIHTVSAEVPENFI